MFKHILLPIDGSKLSEEAARNAIEFAKSINASVTGFHVIVPDHSLMIPRPRDTDEQYYEDSRHQAEGYLDAVGRVAHEAGVPYETDYVIASHPYEAIIRAAEAKGCDLIVMASHGRHGVQGLLIGSETNKVLTHTKLPVLVLR